MVFTMLLNTLKIVLQFVFFYKWLKIDIYFVISLGYYKYWHLHFVNTLTVAYKHKKIVVNIQSNQCKAKLRNKQLRICSVSL